MLRIEKIAKNFPSREEKRVAFKDGNAPEFIDEIENFIMEKRDTIKTINVSLYLFNNTRLFNFLRQIVSVTGIEVNVISIPLDGYDMSSKVNVKFTKGQSTKYDHAYKIYKEIEENPMQNFNFYILPHVYIRSAYVEPFSRGKMPCSLHIKSMYLECEDNQGYTIITSSNLAICDYSKDDFIAFAHIDEEDNENAKQFYKDLISNCVHNNHITAVNSDYNYPIAVCKPQHNAQNNYIAPFYQDSPMDYEAKLYNLIKEAQERVVICGQHVCSYDYTIMREYRLGKKALVDTENRFCHVDGFLSALFEMDKNVDVSIISQTYAEKNRNTRAFKPFNPRNFENFIEDYKKLCNKEYYVKNGLHAKFIVVDDVVVLSTTNFTASQFTYLPYVDIPKFEKIENASYKGIFSEVGQYIYVQDEDFANSMVEWFAEMTKTSEKML